MEARTVVAPPRWRRPVVLFLTLAMTTAVVCILALWQLQRSLELDFRTNLDTLQRILSDESLLKDASEPRANLAGLDRVVRRFENRGYFGSITVTKLTEGTERVVYPFTAPAILMFGTSASEALRATLADHALPGRVMSDAQVLPLVIGGTVAGHAFVRMTASPADTVRLLILALSVVLVVGLTLLVVQFLSQEVSLSRTTVELAEKRGELVRIERLALAGQLAANLLHDLKKPILNMRHGLDDFEDEIASKGAGAGSDVASQLRGQMDLFFAMLRESSLERFVRSEGEAEFVDVNDSIERSLSLVQYERRGVALQTQLAPELPLVKAVPVRLIQVFSNLVLNAYQALGGAGTLRVESCHRHGMVEVTIADNGSGIPEALRERIFDPFVTTKGSEQGTGLGLYISRDIVRDLGGDIDVKSGADGTVFRVAIPAAGRGER